MQKAKTAAQRQSEYRRRHTSEGTDCQLSMLVSAHAKAALMRLSRHHGLAQRAMVERLVGDAESDVIDILTPRQRREYLGE